MSRIVIVGGGIVGLSVARAALARRHQVVVLEQGELPNPHGASFDQHRMIRPHYGDAVGYTRMVADAFDEWDAVWCDLGTTHFADSGAIALSLRAGDYADRTCSMFRTLNIEHRVMQGAELARLCPQLDLPAEAWGVIAHPAGPLFADRILRDLIAHVRARGGDLRAHTAVTAIDAAQGRVNLACGETLGADLVVVAAGAWLPGLLPEEYGALPTHRQALCYVEPPAAHATAWAEGPAIVTLGDTGVYALPPRAGTGLKFGDGGHRRRGVVADGFGADLAEADDIIAAFAPYLRDPHSYRPQRMVVGYYMMDSSRRFRVDRRDRRLVITNCDGQMFKFGPLIGERVLDAFEGRIGMSDLARWAAGQ